MTKGRSGLGDCLCNAETIDVDQFLAALPPRQSTRISIARMIGEFMIPVGGLDSFVEYRNPCELGGADASGPLAVADLIARVGAGEYRVSTYGLEPRGFVRFGEEPS